MDSYSSSTEDEASAIEGPHTQISEPTLQRAESQDESMQDIGKFGVYLGYSREDKEAEEAVEIICEELKQRGLKPWFDKEQIPPGRLFQDMIQQGINESKSAAIFFGQRGLSKLESLIIKVIIAQCINGEMPVIPVLLPNVTNLPSDLLFLQQYSLVRFKKIDDPEALDALQWGITGEHPQRTRA